MSNPFMPNEAGVPVPANTSARYYQRQQIFSRVPISKSQWSAGKSASWVIEATGGRYWVPQESRIVAQLTIKHSDGTKLKKSVRFAADPLGAGAFSAGMLSCNGTTVSSIASNVADISYLQLRTEHTKAGADGPGSAGMLSFNQVMTQEEFSADNLDFAAGGSDDAKDDALMTNTKAGLPKVFSTTAERSDKHEVLVRNCSADALNNDGSETKPVEISTPLGQIFPFCRQDKAFLPNTQWRIDLTINDKFAEDMFFSEDLRGTASTAAVTIAPVAADTGGTATKILSTTGSNSTAFDAAVAVPGYVPPVAAVTVAPQVTVEDIYIDAMFAIPSQVIPVPRSIQVPFQDIEVFTRKLSAGNNYVENFTSVSPGVGAICCALRDSSQTIGTNRELYSLGGGPKGFKTWAFSLGNLQLPIPQYQMDIESYQSGRSFADWLSFTGGSYANGVGGEGSSLTSWKNSPILAARCLQDPGSYSSTATVRFTTKADIKDTDHAELVFWVISTRVMEAFWSQGETFPDRVLVDTVLP